VSVRLYAIARAGALAPDCGGAEGEPLRIVRCGGLAALVGTAAGAGAQAVTEPGLWRHEQAVEALMADQDVLPARYGTRLDDDEEVRVLLERRAGEFDAALAHVSGAVEVGVRAALAQSPAAPGEATAPSETGTAYLQALKHREELARELATSIGRTLRPLSRDSRIAGAWGPSGTLASAHLVRRESVAAFRERADRLARETEYAELVCTGPWPPYSFVGAGAQE
jgi:hypothetical protein